MFLHLFVSFCVCACSRVCVWVCARARVSACAVCVARMDMRGREHLAPNLFMKVTGRLWKAARTWLTSETVCLLLHFSRTVTLFLLHGRLVRPPVLCLQRSIHSLALDLFQKILFECLLLGIQTFVRFLYVIRASFKSFSWSSFFFFFEGPVKIGAVYLLLSVFIARGAPHGEENQANVWGPQWNLGKGASIGHFLLVFHYLMHNGGERWLGG